MDYLGGHVLTLANSIIGVGILAMPYCFKQCGIILSIFILLISSIISRLASHFLLKSAIIARRKTFEFLAFHIFGSLGKFCIEIGMIGYLLGTCIAFFVVMGDLAPDIVSQITGAKAGYALRNTVLVVIAVFCVLPLGLLKNVDSLTLVSRATIGFYCCLVLKSVIDALPHIFTGDWLHDVNLWRPAGILQCLPIFSMALFCQSQIFEIYQALPNASLEKMNSLVRAAVSMCTWVYIFVGTFGYIAFFKQTLSGNVLINFEPSPMSDAIKIGFILSLAFTFPLVIFPCRASLYSLLYKGPNYSSFHEGNASNYIPEIKFKLLTISIVVVSLVIGIAIPNIELVLGLVGSTIGVAICVLFPVTCFICISPKNTNERILAQLMLCIGVIVMVLGTYANLYAYEVSHFEVVTLKSLKNVIKKDLIVENQINDIVQDILVKEGFQSDKIQLDIPNTSIKSNEADLSREKPKPVEANELHATQNEAKEVRHEPPQPEEPQEPQKISPKPYIPKESKPELLKKEPAIEPIHEKTEKAIRENENKIEEKPKIVVPIKTNEPNKSNDLHQKKSDEVDVEAIKKEDTELKEQAENDKKADKDSNQLLIDTLKKQNEMQQVIVEQNKQLIEVIKNQQDQKIEEKMKAVKEIESIALKAIESISANDKKKSNNSETVETNKKAEIAEAPNNFAEPLPIAIAKFNNATKIEPKKNETEAKKEEIVEKEGRDKEILRRKREIDVGEYRNAIRKACRAMDQLTSTEKPIIRMLCRLSEPDALNKGSVDALPPKAGLKLLAEHQTA